MPLLASRTAAVWPASVVEPLMSVFLLIKTEQSAVLLGSKAAALKAAPVKQQLQSSL